MATESRTDPAKLRVAGRDLLTQLDAKHEVIFGLQQVVDDTWRQAYDIEARIKAILVHLGLTSASEPFDEDAATIALRESFWACPTYLAITRGLAGEDGDHG